MGAFIYNCTNCRRGAYGKRTCEDKETSRSKYCSEYKEKAALDGNREAARVKHPINNNRIKLTAFRGERQ